MEWISALDENGDLQTAHRLGQGYRLVVIDLPQVVT